MDGLALHSVKSVAASPQKVPLFLAHSQLLQQGPERTENASEAKIHQAINGQHLTECTLTDLLINAALSSAECKNERSYKFSPPCAFMACMWTPLCIYLLTEFQNPYTAVHPMDISNLVLYNREPVTKLESLE